MIEWEKHPTGADRLDGLGEPGPLQTILITKAAEIHKTEPSKGVDAFNNNCQIYFRTVGRSALDGDYVFTQRNVKLQLSTFKPV